VRQETDSPNEAYTGCPAWVETENPWGGR
jgi:hypothetical protein